MIELALVNLLEERMQGVFRDYSLLTRGGELKTVKVYTQFLPQPKGISFRDKTMDDSILPRGYEVDEIVTLFPCAVIRVDGTADEIDRSNLRRSVIRGKIVVGTYDDNPDCQGYRDVFNIMDRIRLELLGMPGRVLGEQFRLIPPYNSRLLDDNEWPYFFGSIDMNWECAQPMYSYRSCGIYNNTNIRD